MSRAAPPGTNVLTINKPLAHDIAWSGGQNGVAGARGGFLRWHARETTTMGQRGPGQYSRDGRWWWDGERWVSVEAGAPPLASAATAARSKWSATIPGLRYVPGFRTSTWWKAAAASAYYLMLAFFAIVLAGGRAWGGALFFGSWIPFGVALAYGWTLRRRSLPLVAMIGLVLASMSACVVGVAISPSATWFSPQRSSPSERAIAASTPIHTSAPIPIGTPAIASATTPNTTATPVPSPSPSTPNHARIHPGRRTGRSERSDGDGD